MSNNNKLIHRILVIVAYILGIVFIVPLFWMIRSSLMNLVDLFAQPPMLFPKKWIFSNYPEALKIMDFTTQLFNSLIISVSVAVGTVITSSLSAFAFARLKFPGRNAWFSLTLSTMMLPGAVTLIPVFTGYYKLGLYGTLLPLIVPAWLGGGAFFIFMLRQFFLGIPKELDEAAMIDGSGYLRLFIQILLPLIKPALVVVALFSFIGSWNEVFYTNIYLNQPYLFNLTIGLSNFKGLYMTKYSYIMAVSAVVMIPTLILFIIGNRYFVEGITLTGVKG